LSAVPGDASNLVAQAGAGPNCPSENPQRLAETVVQMYQMPSKSLAALGQNGKKFYHENMNMSKGVEKFEKLFQSVVNGRR
jgi:hypothetical protein